MQIVGHEEVRHWLQRPAQVTLIEGPDGVGKRLLAREAAYHLASPSQVIEVGVNVCTQGLSDRSWHNHGPSCDVMTSKVAEYIVWRCRTKSPTRVIVFDAGKATTDAANALLKVLEEPPENTYFLMHASHWVLPTIASRAERISVVPLHDDDVRSILVSHGVPEERAAMAMEMAGGRPGRAFIIEQQLMHRAAVIQLLKAAAEVDRNLLSNALHNLVPRNEEERKERESNGDIERGKSTIELLRRALTECRMQHPQVFSFEEMHGLENLSVPILDRAIRLCGRQARSELVARVVVEFLMKAVEEQRRRSGSDG